MERMVITFKDGSMDWVDPVVKVRETEDELIIFNGYHEYPYKKSEIEKHEIVTVSEGL